MEVTPLNPSGLSPSGRSPGAPGDTLEFKVALNTHSVDLSFDLAALAVLRDDDGREVGATLWDGGQGGHHLSGKLSFPAWDSNGTPLVAADTRYVELLIRDVAGVPERVFHWELKP